LSSACNGSGVVSKEGSIRDDHLLDRVPDRDCYRSWGRQCPRARVTRGLDPGDWYSAVFGLRSLGGSKADDGSWRIENLGNERLLVEIIRDRRAQGVDRALGFRKVGFYVPDVETVAERIARATGERPRVVDFEELNQRILQIRDPGGNIIQLLSSLEKPK
jgi:hypothetical protein